MKLDLEFVSSLFQVEQGSLADDVAMAEFTKPEAKLECSYLTKVVKEQRKFSLSIRLKFHCQSHAKI